MKEIDKNKKIRIVAFQNAHNFGAVCQAYGLQQALQSMGYKDVLFLNYNPEYLKNRYDSLERLQWLELDMVPFRRKITRVLKWAIFACNNLYRNLKFKYSIKTLLKQTSPEESDANKFENYPMDVLICGSDQIWNTSLTHTYDPLFWGDLRMLPNVRKVAYAPSTELAVIENDDISEIVRRLDNFDSVSLREGIIRDYIQPYTPKPLQVCVDSTILCGVEKFNKVVSKRLVKRPYICIYAYNHDDAFIKQMIESIPNYKQYEIHYVSFSANNELFRSVLHSAVSVQDFLSYIKYADYVVTGSFHGLAFSLLFKKNFNVAVYKGMAGRMKALLSEIGLMNRFINPGQEACWDEIDYDAVDLQLEKLRNRAKEYLVNSIEK